LTTLGHNQITTYIEFTQRLMDRFDQGDPQLHFREITQLRQIGSPEIYIEELQRIAMMVPDVSQARLMMLFTEGLMEPLKGCVKDFKPSNLHETLCRTRDLMVSAARTKFAPRPPINQGGRDQRGVDRGKVRMDEATRRDLRRKQLCFTYKEPWDPGHKCMGKGKGHYIEVISDDEEEDFGHIQNIEANPPRVDPTKNDEGEEAGFGLAADKKVTIASIGGVPKFNTFRMRGVL